MIRHITVHSPEYHWNRDAIHRWVEDHDITLNDCYGFDLIGPWVAFNCYTDPHTVNSNVSHRRLLRRIRRPPDWPPL